MESIPKPRALEWAKYKNYPCTINAWSEVIVQKIEKFATDEGPVGKFEFGEGRKVSEKHTFYSFDGCITTHDGMPFLMINETFFWENGKVKASGKKGLRGRYGRWEFFSADNKRIGTKDYYNNRIIKSVGKHHSLQSPIPRMTHKEMESKI